MGKAFTEEEKVQAREKLRRTGLRLFAEKGMRGVSVRELTAAAGISQGGFYTFYKDKDEFLADLIELRITEKLAAMSEKMEETLADPAGSVAEMFYREGMHLRRNKAFDNMISGTLDFYINRRGEMSGRISALYRDYFEKLAAYWIDSGLNVEADTEGLVNLICAAGVLFSNASLMNEEYFEKIYRNFCYSGTEQFLKVSK